FQGLPTHACDVVLSCHLNRISCLCHDQDHVPERLRRVSFWCYSISPTGISEHQAEIKTMMLNIEPVTFTRDCEAILSPAGDLVEIPVGTHGSITQELGGSFTVYIAGNLIRIAGEDADAIGKEPPEPLKLPDNATSMDVEELVWEQLRTVYDPEIPI